MLTSLVGAPEEGEEAASRHVIEKELTDYLDVQIFSTVYIGSNR